MTGGHGILVADFLYPVCTRIVAILILGQQVCINIFGPVAGIVARVDTNEVHYIHILLSIQHLGQTIDIRPTDVTVVRHLDLTSLTLLGGHEDHTVSSSRTVDGAGCSVLQHVDTLDVGRVQVVDITTGHTVDNVKRSGVTIGTSTTDSHLKAITGLTRYGLNRHTRALALESAEHLCGVHLGDVLTLHLNSSTSDQLLLLDTITYDNHFVKNGIVVLHRDVEMILIANGNLLSLVTDETDNEGCTGFNIDREVTVEVSNHTVTGVSFFYYAGTDDGTHSIDYITCNLLRCLLDVLHVTSGIGV